MEHSPGDNSGTGVHLEGRLGPGCVLGDGPGKCSTHASTYMGLEARLVTLGPFWSRLLVSPDTPF